MPLLQQINRRAREQTRSGLRFAHGASQLTVIGELARLMSVWFPEEYAERISEVRAPQSEWIPIFVCSLSAPFIPTPLHIFEPRYRLMMRRALESNQRFGMCLPTENGFSHMGTMLFIDRFEQLPDGRSMVGTKGISRFFVLRRGELDGYSTALIRTYEEDTQGFPTSQQFHAEAEALRRGAESCLDTLQRMQGGRIRESIEGQLGPLPDPSSPQFDAHMSFYAASLLQQITSPRSIADPSDLVFLQPEKDRWQALLQESSTFKPFGDQLKALQGAGDGDVEQTTTDQDMVDSGDEEE